MHVPVLLKEVINYLSPQANENFIDCTIGGGGHTLAIIEQILPNGKILGIDISFEVIRELKFKIQNSKLKNNLILVNDNFTNLLKIVKKYNFKNVAGILFDLGLSSDLLEKSGKGFSFQKDEFLDMRYGGQGETAYEIVNQYPEEKLERILKEYGEERLAQPIVKNILKKRRQKKIKTTKDLVEVVNEVLEKFKIYNFPPKADPPRVKKLKVKTLARVFQALRIVVNNELENLEKVLPQAIEILKKEGNLVVISYHSLEDRIIKNFFRQKKKEGEIKILTKKPIRSTFDEIKKNPRSRSAKLRAAQKL